MSVPQSQLQQYLSAGGNIAGLLGGVLGGANTANANNNVSNYAGNTVLQPWQINNNGVSAGYAGNQINTNLGTGLTAAGSGLQGLAAAGTNAASQFMNGGLPANIAGAYGSFNNNFGNVNSGLSSLFANNSIGNGAGLGVLGAGGAQLGNPLIAQAQSGAGNLINSAGADFNSVYTTQLSSLMQQLQRPQQLQMDANRNNQFSMGTLGTTGGGLQTEAMARGFGQADLGAAQQAYSQAMNAQNSATQNAGILGTLASNQQLTGANLLNTGGNLLTGTGYAGNSLGSNLNSLNMSNLNTQGQVATMPSALAGATLGNLTTPSLNDNNLLNQLGLSNFGASLAGGQALSGSNMNAAGALSRNPFTGSTGASNALSGLSNLLPGLGSTAPGSLGSILSQIPGLSSLFGGGAATGGSGGFGGFDLSSIGLPDMGINTSTDATSGLDYVSPDQSLGGFDPNSINFSGAGGQAAGASNLALGAAGLGIAGGLMSGKPTGYASAGISGARLAGKMSGNSDLTGAAGVAGNALGIYTGLQKGGVAGDTQAAVNAANLGVKGAAASGALSTGAASAASGALSDVAAPLAVYNAASNWKQGDTLSNTVNSAEAGAAIGSIIPGVGTLAGAVIGGVVGLGTSLIQGPHTMDNITSVGAGQQVIKLQSGNSALQQGGVAFGAGSSNKQGSAQWFLVPQANAKLGNGPSVNQNTPFWIGTQASTMLTNFANSAPLKNGSPDFSSYLTQYQKNPNANTGLVGVYNNNGGQGTWGQSFGDWLQSIWGVKHNVTGNLTTA